MTWQEVEVGALGHGYPRLRQGTFDTGQAVLVRRLPGPASPRTTGCALRPPYGDGGSVSHATKDRRLTHNI